MIFTQDKSKFNYLYKTKAAITGSFCFNSSFNY